MQKKARRAVTRPNVDEKLEQLTKKRMFKTNQDIIGEQCIRNDDVLTVSKLLYKLLNTEFA